MKSWALIGKSLIDESSLKPNIGYRVILLNKRNQLTAQNEFPDYAEKLKARKCPRVENQI